MARTRAKTPGVIMAPSTRDAYFEGGEKHCVSTIPIELAGSWPALWFFR